MKRILLLVTVALVMATMVIVSAPAHAAKPPPREPLVITQITDAEENSVVGPTAVPLALDGGVFVTFNQELDLGRKAFDCTSLARLINLNTGEDVTTIVSCANRPDGFGGTITDIAISPPEVAPGIILWECGTTYEVILGGKGRRALKSVDRTPISGAPDGVTLDRGVASWTFTTVACS
jgi:hypothetical protein